ncbi:protein translocase SEC61 complex subunit gamma [Candidatus Woesearchaeota archaeon]|nr:protein translocase SEC61 complex subunit gamma [Candidatus Woesearchaeota archaeon]
MDFKNIPIKLKTFATECRRVFLVTRKPGMQEFKIIVKVSAIGMIIIGFVGFIITIVSKLLGF